MEVGCVLIAGIRYPRVRVEGLLGVAGAVLTWPEREELSAFPDVSTLFLPRRFLCPAISVLAFMMIVG